MHVYRTYSLFLLHFMLHFMFTWPFRAAQQINRSSQMAAIWQRCGIYTTTPTIQLANAQRVNDAQKSSIAIATI